MTTADDEVDSLLAELLTELADQAAQGSTVDIESACRQHPELAAELRRLWGAVMIADAVGGQARQFRDDETGPPLRRDHSPMQLPCRFGAYELRSELGRGGMGVVYLAHQPALKRDVAIKMLLRGRLASPEDEARFRQEAESAARLQHPGIVPVYEVGEQHGQLFFSMKYVDGETLSHRVAKGPMLPRDIARILESVTRAVHFAHEQGVLHRDLKPSNILIDSDDEPLVTDFGLARPLADGVSLTRTGAVLGTPSYMAPEQAAGKRGQVGRTSDVYSLGCILYHMLTGRPPFQSMSPVDAVLMVLEQDPPMPREIYPKVDRDLEMIALRCLQKPPDLRYSNAMELADDLRAYLRDEPIAARSGRFSHVVASLFRETHHAPILENWGMLWMWHSLVLLVVCFVTNGLNSLHVTSRWQYSILWTVGLGTWAVVFWGLRRRMGPVTFVERQIAHIWAGGMLTNALAFLIEYLLQLPVLKLSPVVALSSGMVFLVKAGILSGTFYVQSIALFMTSLAMARWPDIGHLIFGVVAGISFFVPGWKYHRQRQLNGS